MGEFETIIEKRLLELENFNVDNEALLVLLNTSTK